MAVGAKTVAKGDGNSSRSNGGKLQQGPKQSQQTFEFCGPYAGPLVIVVCLPLICYALALGCHEGGCLTLRPRLYVPPLPADLRLFTWEAMAAYIGYILVQVTLHLLLEGQWQEGTELAPGKQLTYKLTSFRNLAVTMAACAALWVWQPAALVWVHDQFLPLLTAAIMFTFAFSAWLYAASFIGNKRLAAYGSSGYWLYDFWMGRELNPRWGQLDLKEFCELYPGLSGWVVLNLSMAAYAAQRDGRVGAAMVLVNAFQLLYVADSAWFEPAILTTMDITQDGFGFMLVFGDLCWVPFIYSLQARYLAYHAEELSWLAIVAIVALKAVGYLIFRGSNSQKDRFRRDPTHPANAGLKTIDTKRGRRLLIDGWWGVSRHINYFGDWLMAVAWVLPCGFGSVIPYFHAIYFAILLLHRDRRDAHACHEKYGKDW
eukprot:CAMPEP_0206145244 /NCGR_PEP_ID=MMETSP1473-20131121/26782_1 /ASSEMBLY_ACC=CAM_ASM_001109 /TAXON_ID=1461547 /ORGANISM="Stichococcus sp, Strain RCC1054" /LENGTH=429 /DNA_ID=CAMNT_0053541383 /DNA_START=201 /DNA_END=1487 /DNA_ORIENTATION=+